MMINQQADAYELVVHPEVHVIDRREDGYAGQWKRLRFIVSTAVEQDVKRWLHASVSRSDLTLPTYDDLMHLKRLCIGEHRTALPVFPPTERHVDIAGPLGVEVLHLWSCLDGDVTPDLTSGTGSI